MPKRGGSRIVTAGQRPSHAGVKYGSHERNTMDVWLADSDQPTAAVVSFHAGGFKPRPDPLPRAAEEGVVPRLKSDLRSVHKAGISVIAATHDGIAPEPFEDATRAIQFVRHMASVWNIDKSRLAATGTSSGGCLSLWLAYHKDIARPTARDPVARESTTLACVAVNQAVTSLDPRFIRELMPGCSAYRRFEGFFGYEGEDLDSLSPKTHALMEELSPINHVRKGAPPTLLRYNGGVDKPFNIHHASFGLALKDRMASAGSSCDLIAGGQAVGDSKSMTVAGFLRKILAG